MKGTVLVHCIVISGFRALRYPTTNPAPVCPHFNFQSGKIMIILDLNHKYDASTLAINYRHPPTFLHEFVQSSFALTCCL